MLNPKRLQIPVPEGVSQDAIDYEFRLTRVTISTAPRYRLQIPVRVEGP